MYKIYINEIPLILKQKELVTVAEQEDSTILLAKYTGKLKHLLQYIDLCEKGTSINKIILYAEDYKQLKRDFLSLFVINKAAGGLIMNEFGETLFIFRRGFWDMPKGKFEKGETKKQTALREVNEETGIKQIEIKYKIGVTNHVFKNKAGIRIIKKSYWYLMQCPKQKLIPQSAEDIEEAVWMTIPDFLSNCKPIYKNILDIIEKYQNKVKV
ncbi:MAG: NUDIX domain-containing protein [Saprospiraceae bacterium]|nr:NUDIX domain-containing protein [Saprospiraceae bacterium]MBK8632850.1 NUDIX domain-containing protein [Saprospiraceae bacterium]MBP7641732.1 NUDIX domain-containing protein [Saprospiraceae bacterium]